MSTHNICIRREIKKILCGYPLLSVAMVSVYCYLNWSLKMPEFATVFKITNIIVSERENKSRFAIFFIGYRVFDSL